MHRQKLQRTIKQIDDFGRIDKKGDLGMAILESTAAAEMGEVLVKTCYNVEGDSPLILCGHEILAEVEASIIFTSTRRFKICP